MKYLFVLFALSFSLAVMAQKGTIRGTVIEDDNGLSVIGANVVITEPLTGVSTDLDGKFSIDIVPGTYEVQVSFISFQKVTIKEVVVKEGEVTLLGNIRLKSSALELSEVVVTATATRKSEAALNTMKKKSVAMMDGISAEKMQLTGDATAVEAAKRVTGVSIEGGKYIYVRGLGDRYSKVMLNNVDIPGLDPDKNSLQMDIFPSNLIDNITVSKNFTADMPADFAGGVMNVETKDFPDDKILSVSAGVSFNPNMHFNSDYLTYEGSSTDFLGFDNGERALPSGARSPQLPTPVSGASSEEINDFTSTFNPKLGAVRETSLLDYSMGFTIGDQLNLNKKEEVGEMGSSRGKLGYIFSLSYKTDYKYFDEVEYGEYQVKSDPNEMQLLEANKQTGQLGERNFLLGGLAGLAYKTKLSKYRLTLMRLQNSESRSGKFNLENNPDAVGQSGYSAISDNLEYNERSLTNLLLNGTHVLDKSGWDIDWRLSPTLSTSEDPDIRKTAFTILNDRNTLSPGQGGMPNRIWRSLEEVNLTGKVDFTRSYQLFNEDSKLRFGFSYNYKQRDYEILEYTLQLRSTISQSWDEPDPNQILDPSNIYPNRPNGVYYQSANNIPNSNEYQSNVVNRAAYVSNEFSLNPNLRAILGLRVENYIQGHTGRDQSYANGNFTEGNNLDNEKVLDDVDFFPTLNLIYSLAEEQNLRVAYAKTIARPSFKELSFAQIVDPVTNRIFNGALFPYSDWDGNIQVTDIQNVDLRWEKFMPRGQIFSASVFYKTFDNPIELVRIPEQQTGTEYQPRNVGDGELYGIEVEATKSLDFMGPLLQNFSLSGNLTLVESKIEMSSREFRFRKDFERTGQSVDNVRDMAGQAPYVVNFGITYSNIDKGLRLGAFYNVKGRTLEIVGAGLFPDIYREPFHSLNLGINKKLGEEGKTTVDFKVNNILDDRIESFFQSFEAQDQIFNSLNPGRTFSLGVSHSF